MASVLEENLYRNLEENVIEEVVLEDPDARFHQHKLCYTCQKAILQSKVMSRLMRKLLKPLLSLSDSIPTSGVADVEETFHPHESADLLLESMQAACHLCSSLYSGILDRMTCTSSNRSPAEVAKSTNLSRSGIWHAPLVLREWGLANNDTGKTLMPNGRIALWKRDADGTENEYGPMTTLDIIARMRWLATSKDYPFFRTAPDTLFSLCTSFLATFEWIKELMRNCQTLHEPCKKSFDCAIQIPKRLLGVSGFEARQTEQESAIMGEIYRGSVCTIAASAVDANERGLFSSSNLLSNPLDQLNIRTILNAGWIPADPLSTRGWIVQERALSQRTIFYRKGTVGWECVETRVEEQGLIDRSDQSKSRFHNLCLIKLGKVDLNAPHLLKSKDSLFLFLTYWRRLLEMYTTTELTKPSDKLVEINGIVSKIRQSAGLSFIAGLWEELLPLELLWTFVYAGEMPLTNPAQEYRTPIWSWACLDGPVTNRWVGLIQKASKWKWMVVVLEATAKSLLNGQVLAAHLRLSGPLRCFRKLGGGEARDVSIARLWRADDGINVANEELWALLIARIGGSDLKETESGIELSTKDIGLILTQAMKTGLRFNGRLLRRKFFGS